MIWTIGYVLVFIWHTARGWNVSHNLQKTIKSTYETILPYRYKQNLIINFHKDRHHAPKSGMPTIMTITAITTINKNINATHHSCLQNIVKATVCPWCATRGHFQDTASQRPNLRQFFFGKLQQVKMVNFFIWWESTGMLLNLQAIFLEFQGFYLNCSCFFLHWS